MRATPIAIIHQVLTLLMVNGQTTHRVIEETTRLAHALGLDIQMVPQWEGMACRIRPIEPENRAVATGSTELIVVRPVGIDMNKVARTLDCVQTICQDPSRLDQTNLERSSQALNTIAELPPSSNLRFILMAGFGAAALGLIFGVTEPVTLMLIWLAAAAGALVRRLVSRCSSNLYVQPLIAAWIAGLSGGLAERLLDIQGLQFVVIAPCMILVPGAHILNGSLDLVRGRLGLGVHRMVYSAMILMAICTGLLLGIAMTDGTLSSSIPLSDTPLWLDILCAGIAVCAFGAFFSLPWGVVAIPMAIGMLAHGSRWWILDLGGGLVLGALVACVIAGTLHTFLARRLKLPFAALAFASVVSLMPGIFVFRFADGLITIYTQGASTTLATLSQTASDGTAAMLIVLAMTLGLIIPKMLIEGLWLRDTSK